MKCRKHVLTGAVLAAAFAPMVVFGADNITSSSDDFAKAPKAVQDGIAREYPGAKVTDCDKDKENDIVRYKVSLTDQLGVKHDLLLSADGKVLEDKSKENKETK